MAALSTSCCELWSSLRTELSSLGRLNRLIQVSHPSKKEIEGRNRKWEEEDVVGINCVSKQIGQIHVPEKSLKRTGHCEFHWLLLLNLQFHIHQRKRLKEETANEKKRVRLDHCIQRNVGVSEQIRQSSSSNTSFKRSRNCGNYVTTLPCTESSILDQSGAQYFHGDWSRLVLSYSELSGLRPKRHFPTKCAVYCNV